MPREYAETVGWKWSSLFVNSLGRPSRPNLCGHDEPMAGTGGSEQPQRVGTNTAAGALPVLAAASDAGGETGGDSGTEAAAGGVLDLLGDPSVAEIHLASCPESASTARR